MGRKKDTDTNTSDKKTIVTPLWDISCHTERKGDCPRKPGGKGSLFIRRRCIKDFRLIVHTVTAYKKSRYFIYVIVTDVVSRQHNLFNYIHFLNLGHGPFIFRDRQSMIKMIRNKLVIGVRERFWIIIVTTLPAGSDSSHSLHTRPVRPSVNWTPIQKTSR